MKNHFYMPYYGNKRQEVENIYQNIIDLSEIDIIVEPFCGSCAISYFISLKYTGKKYILNDKNKYLKEMYQIMTDNKKIKKFEKEFNRLVLSITSNETYKEITKPDNIMAWFIKNKIYHIRPGMFYINNNRPYKKTVDLKSFPIYDFFNNNDIVFTDIDALDVYEEYKCNSRAMIFLDPPYMQSCNEFYSSKVSNIYEYLYNHNINKEGAYIVLILEDMWIVRLLFKTNNIAYEYDKTYEACKKKTRHIIILNWI